VAGSPSIAAAILGTSVYSRYGRLITLLYHLLPSSQIDGRWHEV